MRHLNKPTLSDSIYIMPEMIEPKPKIRVVCMLKLLGGAKESDTTNAPKASAGRCMADCLDIIPSSSLILLAMI